MTFLVSAGGGLDVGSNLLGCPEDLHPEQLFRKLCDFGHALGVPAVLGAEDPEEEDGARQPL